MQLKVAIVYRTIFNYAIGIVSTILLFMMIAIAQFNLTRLKKLMKRYLPESKLNRFIRHHQSWQISQRVHIDYDRCLGSGTWSKVYHGIVFFWSKMINLLFKSILFKFQELYHFGSKIRIQIAPEK